MKMCKMISNAVALFIVTSIIGKILLRMQRSNDKSRKQEPRDTTDSSQRLVLSHNGERDLDYISTLGLMQCCDLFPVRPEPESKHTDITATQINSFSKTVRVYVNTDALPMFAARVLPFVTREMVLLSGCSDSSCEPNETNLMIANHPMIKKWYAQNLTMIHPKVAFMPIAIDYHYQNVRKAYGPNRLVPPREQEELIKEIRKSAPPLQQRKRLAYCNFQFQPIARQDRRDAAKQIDRSLVIWQEKVMTRRETWTRMASCQFVVSPQGNGIDCHRTWEAMALGCIPIVKSHELDPLLSQFPILIVPDWRLLTKERMDAFVKQVSECPSRHEKLQLGYWKRKFGQ